MVDIWEEAISVLGEILNSDLSYLITTVPFLKQDSKELSPRPLANAPKTFYSKKTLQAFNVEMFIKLLLLKGSLSYQCQLMLLKFLQVLKCLV